MLLPLAEGGSKVWRGAFCEGRTKSSQSGTFDSSLFLDETELIPSMLAFVALA